MPGPNAHQRPRLGQRGAFYAPSLLSSRPAARDGAPLHVPGRLVISRSRLNERRTRLLDPVADVNDVVR